MPSPFPSGSGELLVRSRPLSHDEWLALLLHRRADLRPHLDRFTLKTLRQSEFMEKFSNVHELGDREVGAFGDVGLNDQGIYAWYGRCELDTSRFKKCPDRVDYFWGLTRRGQWVHGSFSYASTNVYGYHRPESSIIFDVTLRAVAVHELPFLPVSPQLPKLLPASIWRHLMTETSKWRDRQLKLSEEADQLYQKFALEERIQRQLKGSASFHS